MLKENESAAGDWARELANAWERNDVDAAIKLLSRCVNYRETPFSGNAATEENGIRDLWREILGQKDICVGTCVLVSIGGLAVIKYNARYIDSAGRHESCGIWFLQFENDECVSFEQWFCNRES